MSTAMNSKGPYQPSYSTATTAAPQSALSIMVSITFYLLKGGVCRIEYDRCVEVDGSRVDKDERILA
jgi:hypothetical protein